MIQSTIIHVDSVCLSTNLVSWCQIDGPDSIVPLHLPCKSIAKMWSLQSASKCTIVISSCDDLQLQWDWLSKWQLLVVVDQLTNTEDTKFPFQTCVHWLQYHSKKKTSKLSLTNTKGDMYCKTLYFRDPCRSRQRALCQTLAHSAHFHSFLLTQ